MSFWLHAFADGQKAYDSLAKMNKAARRSCYVTWRAQSFDRIEAESCRLLDKDYKPYPEYPIISNCLYKMGIKADTEIFESTSEQYFTDLDEAVRYFSKNEILDNKASGDEYRSFARSLLTEGTDGFYRKSTTQWVLICWQVDK
jgi:hypothetical protein